MKLIGDVKKIGGGGGGGGGDSLTSVLVSRSILSSSMSSRE